MKKALIPAFLLLLGSTILGATVFREPVAWAAQALSATIAGPLDEQGNVAVKEQGKLIPLVEGGAGGADDPIRAWSSDWVDTSDCGRLDAIIRANVPWDFTFLDVSADGSGYDDRFIASGSGTRTRKVVHFENARGPKAALWLTVGTFFQDPRPVQAWFFCAPA